jgi:hypothetical protein
MRRKSRYNYNCVDCIDTDRIDEFYMVTQQLWDEAGAKGGMLCIGCLEKRLGRELNTHDFIEALINSTQFRRSARLRDRMAKALVSPSGSPTTTKSNPQRLESESRNLFRQSRTEIYREH